MLGKSLIEVATDLGIMIDLSHANEKTFWDIISLVKTLKSSGKSPFIFASHSNCRNLFDKQVAVFLESQRESLKKNLFYLRNLSDEQLLAIKELGGVIGIVSHKRLSLLRPDQMDIIKEELKDTYIQSLKDQFIHLKELFGDTNNIILSSDDMGYESHVDYAYYTNCNFFSYPTISKEWKMFLGNCNFSKVEIESMMYNNFKKQILNRYK